ncbi:hypothetical protein [Streptomyces sp. GbtcB6]|uniref:hypothetical protein n=1 Tax=Streptomyces sp. GbtcB6 TaxID=2824751 RepID=UPI001C30A8D2|nr:hypothetical protein [Streptomyces sp. GbtcB6]
MPRPYTMSPAALEARAKGSGPDGLITRIERAKERLTPAQWDRLRSLLASAPVKGENS